MKILALTKYSQLGASSRLRVFQYLTYLRTHGNEITVEPLFNDEYLEALYSGRHLPWPKILMRYVNRIRQSTSDFAKFDMIWIQKELLPWAPAFFEELLLGKHIPWIVDYDDAVFHQYDIHRISAVRYLLGKKIDRVMARAACVVVGNEYLARRARLAGAKDVQLIPTVIDLNRYCAAPIKRNERFTIGWIGTPITAQYLKSIAPALRHVCEQIPAELMTIGSGKIDLGIPTRIVPWREETEAESIAEFDVGIMPLRDGPFERGKCGYKLIQYMAMGRPVIGSPVGVNTEIIRHGINGFVAESIEDWRNSLLAIHNDLARRKQMGEEARKTVEVRYSMQVTAPRLASIFQDALIASRRLPHSDGITVCIRQPN